MEGNKPSHHLLQKNLKSLRCNRIENLAIQWNFLATIEFSCNFLGNQFWNYIKCIFPNLQLEGLNLFPASQIKVYTNLSFHSHLIPKKQITVKTNLAFHSHECNLKALRHLLVQGSHNFDIMHHMPILQISEIIISTANSVPGTSQIQSSCLDVCNMLVFIFNTIL